MDILLAIRRVFEIHNIRGSSFDDTKTIPIGYRIGGGGGRKPQEGKKNILDEHLSCRYLGNYFLGKYQPFFHFTEEKQPQHLVGQTLRNLSFFLCKNQELLAGVWGGGRGGGRGDVVVQSFLSSSSHSSPCWPIKVQCLLSSTQRIFDTVSCAIYLRSSATHYENGEPL